VKSSEWTEYDGPIAECKGGGGDTVDKEYNAGLLKISERQQAIADEMFNLFKHGVPYDPYDEKGNLTQNAIQLGYDPDKVVSEAELTQSQLAAEAELLPGQTEVAKEQLGSEMERQGVMKSLYKDALTGVDVEGRVSEHRAGVQQAFKGETDIAKRNLGRMGIDPSSGRGSAMFQNIGLEKAKATSLGETQIRRGAETEDFQRKATAAGLPI
jgi:hypothetical protein